MGTDSNSPSPEKKNGRSRRKAEDPEIADLYRRVGLRILQLREAAGLSQRAFSHEVFGRDLQGDVSQWERGRTLPNIGTLYRIAKWAGVSLASLGLYEPDDQIAPAKVARARELIAQAGSLLEG